MKNNLKYLLLLALFVVHCSLFTIHCFSQGIPDKPNPPRLVNDYVGLLSPQEQGMLEQKLDRFNDSSSTQIAVVIVKTLNDLEPADYAQQLGQKWGIGQKGKNNGIVILIKPTGGQGEKKVFIASGYGLEAVIPDATCKLIVENEMIPEFKQNNFIGGIDKAVNVIMALAKKDYPASAYNNKYGNKRNQKGTGLGGIIFVILMIVLVFFFANLNKTQSHLASNKKIPFWTLFWLMMFTNSSSGHWNDFSRGSGGYGGNSGFGGGGGFGGFGGGSFGGGGAGGSW